LYVRSLGQETDVVSKEMFTIAARHEEDEAEICLRPEVTAAVARAFVENNIDQVPWKVYEWGPMFRHERPQKGRFRQFHQVDMEVIGSSSVMQDAQLLKMLDRYFHEVLGINNYALLLNFLGCTADRAAFEVKLKEFLDKQPGICQLCQQRKEKNVLRIFDCKNPSCQAIYQKAPHTADVVCTACANEWAALKGQLELLSVSFAYKPTLVRGLDYYNKTVFEFTSDSLGSQNAFCGGGRYDQLIAQVGGKQDQPSIGAAIGIERLMMVMEPYRATLRLPQLPALHVIMPLSQAQEGLALLLADQLQAHNLATEVLLEGGSVKSMMRRANKLGATYCLLLGENEQQAGTVTVKNMVNGQEQVVEQNQVVRMLS
jgi:histidyl-tRNA synthetase